jgi:hypothetical protein
MQNVNTQDVFTLNPTATIQENDNLFVSWKQNATEISIQGLQNQSIKNYQVFSNTGQKVLDHQVNTPSVSVPLEQLQSGLYLIRTEMNNGKTQVIRFVKP